MSSQDSPTPAASDAQQWLGRLGTSGKLLAIGGIVGVIAAFLPLISVSIEVMGLASGSNSSMVVRDWRGVLCLIGSIGAIGLSFLAYPAVGRAPKNFVLAALAVGGVVAVFSLWLLFAALNATSGVSEFVAGMGGAKVSVGFGAFVNVLAAAAIAAGAFLKAKEEKVI